MTQTSYFPPTLLAIYFLGFILIKNTSEINTTIMYATIGQNTPGIMKKYTSIEISPEYAITLIIKYFLALL